MANVKSVSRRAKPDVARIKVRVAKDAAEANESVAHVAVLNPGFFQLERMRGRNAARRVKVRSR